MQLNSDLLKTTEVKKTKDKTFSEDDLVALEEAATNSKYPSEIKPEGFVKANADTKGSILHIDPSKTRLWQGNPRNFSFHSDLSELITLIKQSKGNVTPVIARRLPVKDANGVDIEIIAGSRRRAACIEACEKLKISLVDVDNDQAKVIAEAENKGRKDTDLFSDSRYLKHIYDEMKKVDPQLTIEAFASLQTPKQTRQTMNDRLKLAEVPLWLQKPVKNPDDWSFRQALRLKKLLNNKELNLAELQTSLKDKSFLKPDGLLAYILDFSGVVKEGSDIEIKINDKTVLISEQKSGQTKIVLPKNSKKLRDEIEQLIRKFTY